MDAWHRWTKKFGHIHRGVYVTLLAWYYSTGGPLPLDWPAIFRIAEAHGDDERNAVRDVLATFFDCRETGWHNQRADDEVTRYARNADNVTRDRMSVTGVTLSANRDTSVKLLISAAKRQQIYRERKMEIIGILRQVGASSVTLRMSVGQLREIAMSLGITVPEYGRKVTPKVTTDTRSHRNTALVLSSEQAREPGVEAPAELVADPAPSPAAELCRRVKQQGLFGLYASKPELVTLLKLGVTDDEIVATAAEAVAKGKGLAWMLATVKGRHTEQPKQAQQGPKSGRGDVKTNRLQAWVPELVAKPPAPDFAFYDDKVPHVPAE
jgi:uncharacterized protein YdaU (DUF1376 family)